MDLDDLLASIAKAVGHKQIEYRMRVSPSLLNQWISGEKRSFLMRTDEFIQVLADLHREDLALALCDRLVQRIGGAVIGAEQVRTIKSIAEKAGARLSLDEWRNG